MLVARSALKLRFCNWAAIRGGTLSSAARAAEGPPPPPPPPPPLPLDLLAHLDESIRYELQNDCVNAAGLSVTRFSELLQQRAAQVLTPDDYERVASEVQQYSALGRADRRRLLLAIQGKLRVQSILLQKQSAQAAADAAAQEVAEAAAQAAQAQAAAEAEARAAQIHAAQAVQVQPAQAHTSMGSGLVHRRRQQRYAVAQAPTGDGSRLPSGQWEQQAQQQALQQAQRPVNGATAAVPAWEQAPSAPAAAALASPEAAEADRGAPAFVAPPMASVSRLAPVLIDLETNDTGVATLRIVEIAARRLGGGSDGTYSTLVRLMPGERMATRAAEITGLPTADLQCGDLPLFSDAYRGFLAFLERVQADAGPDATLLLMGHNIRNFDLPALLHRARASGLPPLQRELFLDTLPLARAVAPGLPNHKLQDLYAHFAAGRAVTQHRALADCETAEVVLEGLLQQMGLPLGADGLLRLVAREQSFSGWVGCLPAANPTAAGSGGQKGRRAAKLRVPLELRHSDLLPEAAVGAAGQEAQAPEEEGGPSEDEGVSEWSVEDPLALVEQDAAADEDQQTYQDLVAQREGWERIGRDPALTDVFLNMPVSALLKGKGRKFFFTPAQSKELQEEGFSTLRHVLEAFPKAYLQPRPGALPPAPAARALDGDAVEEAEVCLPVRMVDCKHFSKNSAVLVAEFVPAHPSDLGWACDVPRADYEARPDLRLKLLEMRRGTYPYLLRNEEIQLRKQFPEGAAVVVQGRVKREHNASFPQGGQDIWKVDTTTFEVLTPEEAERLFSGAGTAIKPVYASAGPIKQKDWAEIQGRALGILQEAWEAGQWDDPIPAHLLERHALPGLLEGMRGMHRPVHARHVERARRRFAFQELLVLQLKLLARRARERPASGEADMAGNPVTDHRLVELGKRSLPYVLTRAQQRALAHILGEMSGWPPMMCLLQGDVGSGKTVVALLALLAAVGSGYQGAIMAPTEVLAEQHAHSLQKLLHAMNAKVSAEGGRGFVAPTFTVLTGSVTGKERKRRDAQVAGGDIDLVVGTHALISDSTCFKRLGLVVIDEQHKFGVEQRAKLSAKSCPAPHVLDMTATPIPRTVALVVHGDRTQVAIDELPPGRQRVVTKVVQDALSARHEMYEHMRQEMAAGAQIYIICPLVEASNVAGLDDLKAAVEERERLVAEGILHESDCGLLHGRMSPLDKEVALKDFAAGKTKVLISTTVVEVGVDVPGASVIAVEHAERFGLAQLHQLRGRVGRGTRQSHCYLITDAREPEVLERLRVLERHASGFAVAERDFAIRGAGEVLGTRQSGRDVKSSLKACQLPRDRKLLEAAREAAALHMREHKQGPLTWSPELLACVADASVMDLDISSV